MTYRSETDALSAELAAVETELAELEQVEHALSTELRARRLVVWYGRARLVLALVAAAGCALYASRAREGRRVHADYAARSAALSFEIESLESRLAKARVAPSAEPPLADMLPGGLEQDVLSAIRDADPRQTTGAWWVMAHAACRAPFGEPARKRALASLAAPERERADAFCSRGEIP